VLQARLPTVKLLLPLLALIAGCARGDAESSGPDAAVDSKDLDSARRETLDQDSRNTDLGSVVSDAAPRVACAIPGGTTVTANASASEAPKVIDLSLASAWNSGSAVGWVRLHFPSPTRFDEVQIAGHATPACDETITIAGVRGGIESTLTTVTRSVTPTTAWYSPIRVEAAAYDEILVSISSGPSWIAIAEITVFDSTCP
jgi:hypothetical protein